LAFAMNRAGRAEGMSLKEKVEMTRRPKKGEQWWDRWS